MLWSLKCSYKPHGTNLTQQYFFPAQRHYIWSPFTNTSLYSLIAEMLAIPVLHILTTHLSAQTPEERLSSLCCHALYAQTALFASLALQDNHFWYPIVQHQVSLIISNGKSYASPFLTLNIRPRSVKRSVCTHPKAFTRLVPSQRYDLFTYFCTTSRTDWPQPGRDQHTRFRGCG